jgi:excisionase family DNA binding protein
MELFPKMLTVAEVAALFQVSTGTIFRWCNSGYLKSVRPMGGKRLIPEEQSVIQAQRRLMDHDG